jgi:TPR repeat protein
MDCVAALAFCHLKGVGTAVNFAKARELCSQSMTVFSPMACFVQSLLHLDSGAPATLKKRSAIPFLQIAAAAEINASAAYNLAVLFSDPSDEFCDIPQAIQLLHAAAALGMQSAKDLLARLVPQNSSSEVRPLPSQPASS